MSATHLYSSHMSKPHFVIFVLLGVAFGSLTALHLAAPRGYRTSSSVGEGASDTGVEEAPDPVAEEFAVGPKGMGQAEGLSPAVRAVGSATLETADSSATDYVQNRVAQLAGLGMNDDPDSLRIIVSELGCRNREIRQAAREAAVQFGSADAIPALAESMLETDDGLEKADIQKAIEFLGLPSVLDEKGDEEQTGG